MLLSAVAKQKGHKVGIVGIANMESILKKIIEFEPHILVISSTSGDYRLYRECIHEIKKQHPDIFTLMGGANTTYFPELLEESGADAFCIGEGEGALTDLLDAMENKKEVSNIPNLWVKLEDGAIIKNPVRPLIQDLDSIPFSDRTIYTEIEKEGYATILSSRGCPFQCTYCYNSIKRKIYPRKGSSESRVRSVGNVIEELNGIMREYGHALKSFQFADECFGFDISWLKEFVKEYRRQINIPFYAQMNPSLITEEKVKLLKEGGCWRINFAIETGVEEFREEILKRYISNKKLIDISRLIRREGMTLSIQNMLLLPKETWETARKTLELNIECRPHIATATKFQPFPKLELTKKAIEMGLINESDIRDAFEIDMHWKSILRFKDVKMKKRVSNLLNLFTFTVRFPIFKPIVYLLTLLPNNVLFRELDNAAWRKITWGSLRKREEGLFHEVKLFLEIMHETLKGVLHKYT